MEGIGTYEVHESEPKSDDRDLLTWNVLVQFAVREYSRLGNCKEKTLEVDLGSEQMYIDVCFNVHNMHSLYKHYIFNNFL